MSNSQNNISPQTFRDAKAVNSRLSLKQLGYPGQLRKIRPMSGFCMFPALFWPGSPTLKIDHVCKI